MLRQVSSRNQRGKGGFKMKNALHICLLVAICVWLLYQMKHSHDKKKAFEERGSNVSFKGDERRPDIMRFSRKNLPRTAGIESAGEARIEEEEKRDAEKVEHGIRHEEVEDEEEGGDGDQEMDRQDEEESEHGGGVTREEAKKGQTKEVEAQEDRESSHKAREISFRGDDASSEVVHIIQEVEHEEGSQEARERSFKADDASSAVAHVPQVNEPESESENGGLRNLDENEAENAESKDGEIRAAANATLEDSSAIKLLHNYGGNNSSIIPEGSEFMHNNTVIRGVGTPILENVLPQNTTTGESETHKEQQPDLRIASVSNNQTDREMHSKDVTGNAVEWQTNSTSFSKQEIYFQKNSTTVSVDQIDAQANLTVKVDPTNVTVLHNQTGTEHSTDGQINRVKLETGGEEKPNLDKRVMEQKADTIARPVESEESYKTSSATSENGKAVQLESGNAVHSLAPEKNGDYVLNLPDIQNRVHSGKQEAAAT